MSAPQKFRQKFRKKPVEIEAIRLEADSIECGGDIIAGSDVAVAQASGWMLAYGFTGFKVHGEQRPFGIAIKTLEGTMIASPGDWIIRVIKGEFYPCKPDIFAATYDAVTAEQVD